MIQQNKLSAVQSVKIYSFKQDTGHHYTQYPLQEIQLQEPVLEFGKKLETTSTEILRLRDIQITGKVDPSKNDYSVSLP